MKKYNVMDLFSGVGGLSYGFSKNPHFSIKIANEIDEDIAKAYCLNHKDVKMINKDIKLIDEELIKEICNEPIDVIIGGPPCQSYSTLGKRKMDSRARLFEEYCRILSIVRPKLFIFENVSGLMSMEKGNLIKLIQKKFKQLGYETKLKIINAVNYGVPQYRDRVIIVGMKEFNCFNYPKPTHAIIDGKSNFVTLEDALSDLPHLKSGEEGLFYISEPKNSYQKFLREKSNEIITENKSPNNGKRLIEIMEALPDGGSKNDLPAHLKPKSGYGNTYAKMRWKKPAPTITRNFATPSSSRCIHPIDSRALTTREGARLQSFPDDYIFYGSRYKKNLEIGNAVPPLLSIHLANSVQKAIEEYDKVLKNIK